MKDLIKTIIPWLKVSGYCAAGTVVGALFTYGQMHKTVDSEELTAYKDLAYNYVHRSRALEKVLDDHHIKIPKIPAVKAPADTTLTDILTP